MARRIKAPSLPRPTSRDEADRLLGEIGVLQRELDAISAQLTETVAEAKERASRLGRPIADDIDRRFKALCLWAETERDQLLEGGRKSVTLSQGVIGWRWGMPMVRIRRDAEDEIVELLSQRGLHHLIRTRQEIDKEAVLRQPELVADVDGLTVEQVETFFAQPLDLAAEQVKTVRRSRLKVSP